MERLGRARFLLSVGIAIAVTIGSQSTLSQDASQAASDSPRENASQSETLQNDTNPEASSLTAEGPSDASAQPSEAERIAELQETLEDDQEQLQQLEREIESPDGEYALAEKEFRSLNASIDRENENLESATEKGDQEQMAKLEQEIASLQRQRKLAEARFELAIEDRKTLREQTQILRSKIKKDQAALHELTGDGQPLSQEGSSAGNAEATSDQELPWKSKDTNENSRGTASESQEETPEKDESEDEEEDEELKAAESEAEQKETEADEAQQETQSLAARIADVQKLIAQEQKELGLARRKVDLADNAQQMLIVEISKRKAESAEESELMELRSDANDASRRLIQARSEVNEIVERLNEHRAELGMLQSEHIIALHEADAKRKEAMEAEDRLESLKNPFAIRNIIVWLRDHGLRLVVIVVGMFALNTVAKFFSHRSIRLVTTGTGRGSKLERENRAKTLVGVFQNAATVGIFITGFLMILEEVGANVTVLMGGVAVIGLAVAFGAQNLIKDYFYGFVMLLENQYMLNDFIRIGTLHGQVERITLRMTVLRDSNGIVHFVPNGTISSVSNETHGWSRAVCEVSIGYEEDLERVLAIMREISAALYADSVVRSFMLEAPPEPAVESLGESSIQIRASAKTLPNKQGMVKQEWLRCVKKRFSELGIRPAHAQRVIRIESMDRKAKTGFKTFSGDVA